MKITDGTSEEALIYDKLLQLDVASRDHILPSTVVRSETQRPFVIMPCLFDLPSVGLSRWRFASVVRGFRQMVEVRPYHASWLTSIDE